MDISYTLGVSASAVTNAIARAQSKLNLNSLAELAAFFAAAGVRSRLAEAAISTEQLLVGSYPLCDAEAIAKLSDSERNITAYLMTGSTYADIAQRRGTSERTIASQVQSIFHKLGVHSRSELATRLQAPR